MRSRNGDEAPDRRGPSATIGVIANQTAPLEWPLRVKLGGVGNRKSLPACPSKPTFKREMDGATEAARMTSSAPALNRSHRVLEASYSLTLIFQPARQVLPAVAQRSRSVCAPRAYLETGSTSTAWPARRPGCSGRDRTKSTMACMAGCSATTAQALYIA